MQKPNPKRRNVRPSPKPAAPNEGRLPNVVDVQSVTPGVLAVALRPYAHLEEVRRELTDLACGRAA